jgi:serine/threonine protein kinase
MEDEVPTMLTLDHDNLIKLKEYGSDGVLEEKGCPVKRGVPYMVLEVAKHGELFDWIAYSGIRLTERFARYFFRQMIEGLEHMHGKGHSHRDLKLQNVLINEEWKLKIADFGFSGPL